MEKKRAESKHYRFYLSNYSYVVRTGLEPVLIASVRFTSHSPIHSSDNRSRKGCVSTSYHISKPLTVVYTNSTT